MTGTTERPAGIAPHAGQGAAAPVHAGHGPSPLPHAAGVRHGRTHARESRDSRHRSTRRALRAALIVTLVLLGLVLLLGWVYTNALRARGAADAERIQLRENELAQLKLELDSVRSERDALATGRLPGLIAIEYDSAIQLDEQYVRNVIFTQTGTDSERRFEYRLVVANTGPAPLRPAVRLLFFDERGIQVGESDVEQEAGAATGTGAWLQPNETRSYTAVAQIRQDAVPRYFLPVVQ